MTKLTKYVYLFNRARLQDYITQLEEMFPKYIILRVHILKHFEMVSFMNNKIRWRNNGTSTTNKSG